MYHIIVNRSAASGQCETIWKKLLPVLEETGVSYEAHLTSCAEETSALVRSLTGQGEQIHLILLGGDGTLNLVFQNILDLTNTRLSIIPVGSGNDFARDMGISRQPAKALLHLLQSPEEVVLDYGVVHYMPEQKEASSANEEEERHFLISCGVGYDAAICNDVNTGSLKKLLNKLKLGKISYLLTGMRHLLGWKASNCSIQAGKWAVDSLPIFLCVAMIHRFEGGGVAFAPKADATDGKFDLCIVKDMKILPRITALVMVMLRRHGLLSSITMGRSAHLEASFQEPLWLHTDGEVLGRVTSCRMICMHGLHFIF